MTGEELEPHPLWAWDQILDDCSYYELLGLLEISDDSTIKAAYHAFARSFHPDGFMGEPEALRAAASRVFERGSEAYRVLSNPKLRTLYDRALATGQLRLDATRAGEASDLPPGSLSLSALCRSPGAKLKAKAAEQSLEAGRLREAYQQLQLALAMEGDGAAPELLERLDAIDLMLFARGE